MYRLSAKAFAIHFVLVGEFSIILQILIEEELIKCECRLFFLCLNPEYT